MLLFTLVDIVGYLISIFVTIVIVQFVLSLLISFNVVNLHNQFVESIWRAVNALLDPILRPVRKLIPPAGGIDFSPMVLIIGLTVLEKLLRGLALASLQ